MKKALVSIIVPCYNGDKFLDRFFFSVLNQTYRNIELVFINDGSNDKSEEIALRFKKEFEDNGFRFIYIFQENAGAAAAINKGLKVIRGDYLCWIDCDDWITEDCIKRKLEVLEDNPQLGFVCCKTAVVNENSLDRVLYFLERHSKDNDHFFEDLIIEHDVYFAPGGYMANTQKLFAVLNRAQIYESTAGQNWQLLLPLAYHYDCAFIDDVLFYYVVREDSHSHSAKDSLDLINRTYSHETILYETIKRLCLPLPEEECYNELIKNKYNKKRYEIFYNINSRDELIKNYKYLKRNHGNTFKIQKCYWRRVCMPIYYLICILHLFSKK